MKFYCRTGCGQKGEIPPWQPWWTWGWHYCDTAYSWWIAPIEASS